MRILNREEVFIEPEKFKDGLLTLGIRSHPNFKLTIAVSQKPAYFTAKLATAVANFLKTFIADQYGASAQIDDVTLIGIAGSEYRVEYNVIHYDDSAPVIPADAGRRSATMAMAQRYADLLQQYSDGDFNNFGRDQKVGRENLLWMCQTIIQDGDSLHLDKTSRWLGFIQGVLASDGFIDVDKERDFSRPLFHAAYESDGISIPAKKEKP